MYALNDQQIDFIHDDIVAYGIRLEGLQADLLDHVCILIEQEMEEGGDLAACYAKVIRSFYKVELREIEEEALLLVKYGHHRVLHRNTFFGWLSVLLIGPFAGYDLVWFFAHGAQTGWLLPFEIWGGTLVFSLFPLLCLLVLFLTPDRLDPLIPRGLLCWWGGSPLSPWRYGKLSPTGCICSPKPVSSPGR